MARPLSDFPPPERDIKIIYQDDFLIAVSKPAWLLSVPGRGLDRIDSVLSRVKKDFPLARSTHRLDFATSGVIILGMSLESEREINRQFRERIVDKKYVAILNGSINKVDHLIELPIICDYPNRPRQIVDFKNGKKSITYLTTDKIKKDDTTRVFLRPVTGRSHQLRVHCNEIGHPIVGDRLYSKIEKDSKEPRLLLHAECISLFHPKTKKRIYLKDRAPF